MEQRRGNGTTDQDGHEDEHVSSVVSPPWQTEGRGGSTQTKSMVNYSPHLAAIHYTAFIIHHMASDMPRKPEQLLSPAGGASCDTSHKANAVALTRARHSRAHTLTMAHRQTAHIGALIYINMMYGCCQFHLIGHTGKSTTPWRRHYTYHHHQPSSSQGDTMQSTLMSADTGRLFGVLTFQTIYRAMMRTIPVSF